MSKLEEKVNEILGIEKEVEKVEKEFKPLVPRKEDKQKEDVDNDYCLLYTSPSPRDRTRSRMPSSA